MLFQVLQSPHWTLVTLLLCNAAALEVRAWCSSLLDYMSIPSQATSLQHFFLLQALPIFLDKLLSPVLAVVLSVTAVLLVGTSANVDPLRAARCMPKKFSYKSQLLLCRMFKHQQCASMQHWHTLAYGIRVYYTL